LLKRIVTAVGLIPIVLLLVLRAPVPVLAVVAALVALLTVRELLGLARGYGIQPMEWATYIFIGLFFILLATNPGGDKALLSTGIFAGGVAFAAALADPSIEKRIQESVQLYRDVGAGPIPKLILPTAVINGEIFPLQHMFDVLESHLDIKPLR